MKSTRKAIKKDTTKPTVKFLSLSKLSTALSLPLSLSLFISLSACQSTPVNHLDKHSAILPSAQQMQLFDFPDNPSVSENSKTRFVTALEQHLATEHMSVSIGKNRVRPFVNSESIDADSQSILQTMLETFAYKVGKDSKDVAEYKKEMMKELIEEVQEEESENIKLAKKEGEYFDAMTEEEISDEAEYRYESDYASEYKEDKKSNDPKKILGNYLKMKGEEIQRQIKETDTNGVDSKETTSQKLGSGNATDVINTIRKFDKLDDSEKMTLMLKIFHRSPEQIEAMQLYLMTPLNYQSIGHYVPKARQYEGVISYDYNSPTTQISAQLPYAVDFTKKSATFDPAILMPVIAFIKPELLTTPEDIKNLNKPNTVTFLLPEEIAKFVPSDVLFDALISGIERGFADMDEEQLTPMALTDDQYAKEINAKRAVKIHWGAKQSGAFLGRVIKSMSRDLHAHINEHPELYIKEYDKEADSRKIEKLKQTLTLWSSVEKDFQSKDVGGLMQMIEAIAPISFNQSMYYYLSENDQLLAYQTKLSIGSELYGWTMDTVQQTRYDQKGIVASPLYALYEESFGKDAPVSRDIMALVEKAAKEDSLQRQARYARYDYPDWDDVEEEIESVEDVKKPIEETEAQAETIKEIIEEEIAEEEQLSKLEEMKHAFEQFEK